MGARTRRNFCSYLNDEYVTLIVQQNDVRQFRVLLKRGWSRSTMCQWLRTHKILEHFLSHNYEIASYLCDRFVPLRWNVHDLIVDDDPFLLALSHDCIDIANQYKHMLETKEEWDKIMNLMVTKSIQHHFDDQWLQCILDCCPQFIKHATSEPVARVVGMIVDAESDKFFMLFLHAGYFRPSIAGYDMLRLLTYFSRLIWFRLVWQTAFGHRKFKVSDHICDVLQSAISQNNFEILNFFVELDSFFIPQLCLKEFANQACCSKSFVDWIISKPKLQCYFLLKSVEVWKLQSTQNKRVIFHLLDKLESNALRLKFLLNQSTFDGKDPNIFVRLAWKMKYAMILDLISRYSFTLDEIKFCTWPIEQQSSFDAMQKLHLRNINDSKT